MVGTRYRSDEGSLVVALLGSVVAAGVMVVVTAAAVNALRTARHDRDFSDSVHAAEIGVEDILRSLNDGTDSACEDAGSCTGSGAAGETTYSYTAIEVPGGNTWEVAATATRNGVTRTIEVVLERPSRFWLAAFTESPGDPSLEMRGSNHASSYDHAGNNDTGQGAVGSNGTIRLHGDAHADVVHVYGPNAVVICSGGTCDEPVEGTNSAVTLETDFILDALAACPTTPTAWRASEHIATPIQLTTHFSVAEQAHITSPVGLLLPHPSGYHCFTDVIFDVPTLVARTPDASGELQPVIVHAQGDVRVDVGTHNKVNCLPVVCTNGGGLDTSLLPAPDAAALQIFTLGSNVTFRNHNSIAAAIYAPNALCAGAPSNAQAAVYGSLICNQIDNEGGWTFRWDENLEDIAGQLFDVVEWREEVGGTTSFTSP